MSIAPTRSLALTLVLIASAGVAALAGPAGAATKASAKVSIQTEEDGFSGFVTSKRRSCESRKVTLYRQAGSKRSTRRDKKVDSDLAQPNGDGSQWKVDVEDDGRYYASVKSNRKCKAATSKTLKIELKPVDE